MWGFLHYDGTTYTATAGDSQDIDDLYLGANGDASSFSNMTMMWIGAVQGSDITDDAGWADLITDTETYYGITIS